jgi:hypothetical protein
MYELAPSSIESVWLLLDVTDNDCWSPFVVMQKTLHGQAEHIEMFFKEAKTKVSYK